MRRSIKSLILNNLGRVLLAASIAGAAAAPRAHAQDLVWAKLFPNWNNYGVSADGLGGVYITGEAHTFPYPAGFLARLESGSIQWSQERNPYGFSAGWDVCADGLGDVYVSGQFFSPISEKDPKNHAFVDVYDAQGTYKWGRVVGRGADTSGTGVSADGLGGVYISGVTNGDVAGPNAGQRDTFLARFGTGEWQAQLGTAQNDEGADVSADGLGNIYITGSTYGSLAGPAAGGGDAFLAKYNTQGAFQWMRQLGTPGDDGSAGVAADGLGNVYISGSTGGDLGGPNAGGSDAFLAKYDPAGNLLWTRQFGSAQSDESRGVSADGIGGVYITGLTYGSLAGPNAGDSDAFIAKYDSAGNFQWARQWGGAFYDRSDDVSADGLGNAYITGQTWISNHEIAGFLVKYGIPEPSSVSLMLVILITAGINARRR